MTFKRKLRQFVNRKIDELGVLPSWLKFAKKARVGFEFLPDDPERNLVLEQICKQAHRDFPHLNLGQIQDALAELVNQD